MWPIVVTADDDGHSRGIAFVAETMRQKRCGRKTPKQLIELLRDGLMRRVQQHAHATLHRLLADLAGGAQLVFAAGIKINFGHVRVGVLGWLNYNKPQLFAFQLIVAGK